MANPERSPVGTVAIALGAALFGFIMGARVKIGNHGATVIVMPIGGDLVITQPEAVHSEAVLPPQPAEVAALSELQTDEG